MGEPRRAIATRHSHQVHALAWQLTGLRADAEGVTRDAC